MSYVTPDDMKDLFEAQDLLEATNLNRPGAAAIDETRLQAACNGANGIANGYLSRRFTIPLPPETPTEIFDALKIHCAAIARNILDGHLEEVRKRHEDAIAWLKLFSDPSKLGGGGDDGGTLPGSEPTYSASYQDGARPYNAAGGLFGW